MARSTGPTVGLDIGSHTIKVAELVPGRGGITVKALGMAPIPEGAVESNIIIDPQLLGQAVKQLLKDSGVSAKSSVSSVAGQSALVVRVIEVPQMSEAELAETMRYEEERHVPFAANEVIMDFQAIHREGTPDDAPDMEVLLAVAQQDMVDRHVEMLFAAGLKPASIDVEPLAVARTYIELSPDPLAKKTIAIVNIGANNTDIGIYQDGILAFPRTLPLAGSSLNRAISGHLGLSDEQAEEYKKAYAEVIMSAVGQAPAGGGMDDSFMDFSVPGAEEADGDKMPFDFSDPSDTESVTIADSDGAFAVPEPEAVVEVQETVAEADPVDPNKLHAYNAIAPVLGELAAEIRRSLDYYKGRGPEYNVDEILLCGGTSLIKNLDQYFTLEFGTPTRVASPLEYTNVATKNFSPEYLQEVAPFYAVAIGLAARDLVSVKVPTAAGKKRGKKK